MTASWLQATRSTKPFFRQSPVGISQSDRVVLGLHPQDFVLADQGSIKGIVQVVERLGHETVIRVRLRDGSESLASLQGQNCDALSQIQSTVKAVQKKPKRALAPR